MGYLLMGSRNLGGTPFLSLTQDMLHYRREISH